EDGAIYVFDTASGEQRVRIVGQEREHLGTALAVRGDDIVAGAPAHPDGATIDIGTVVVFDGARGFPRLTLKNPALLPRRFGASVVVVGGDLVVGAPGAGVHPDTVEGGAAYLFDGTTGTLLRTFRNPTATADDHFASVLATLGRDVAVGAPDDDAMGRD